MNAGAAGMSPQAAANLQYSRALTDYRNCLAAYRTNVKACEGQRNIMEADAKLLSGSF